MGCYRPETRPPYGEQWDSPRLRTNRPGVRADLVRRRGRVPGADSAPAMRPSARAAAPWPRRAVDGSGRRSGRTSPRTRERPPPRRRERTARSATPRAGGRPPPPAPGTRGAHLRDDLAGPGLDPVQLRVRQHDPRACRPRQDTSAEGFPDQAPVGRRIVIEGLGERGVDAAVDLGLDDPVGGVDGVLGALDHRVVQPIASPMSRNTPSGSTEYDGTTTRSSATARPPSSASGCRRDPGGARSAHPSAQPVPHLGDEVGVGLGHAVTEELLVLRGICWAQSRTVTTRWRSRPAASVISSSRSTASVDPSPTRSSLLIRTLAFGLPQPRGRPLQCLGRPTP